VTDVGGSGFEAPKPGELLMKPEERWYRLVRKCDLNDRVER
jgi:hypothetical protein